MNEIYSNADVAARLGCKPNSLNKKRSRLTDSGALAEGMHWFKDGDGIFWTAAGVAILEGDSAAIVASEGISVPVQSDSHCPAVGDFPSPAAIAAAHAPAVVARYLQAVDNEMTVEVTRLLREGDSLGKHLSARWGIVTGGAS